MKTRNAFILTTALLIMMVNYQLNGYAAASIAMALLSLMTTYLSVSVPKQRRILGLLMTLILSIGFILIFEVSHVQTSLPLTSVMAVTQALCVSFWILSKKQGCTVSLVRLYGASWLIFMLMILAVPQANAAQFLNLGESAKLAMVVIVTFCFIPMASAYALHQLYAAWMKQHKKTTTLTLTERTRLI